MNVVTDIGTVFVRELRPTLHNPFGMVFSLVQPLIFLAFFGPLLASTTTLPGGSLWQWFVPGILVMSSLFSCSMTGSNLLFEMQTGAHERLLVTPVSRAAMLVGRALKEIAPLLVQTVLIVIAVLPFGFQLYPVGAVAGIAILSFFGVGMGALSYALALASRNQDWLFWVVQQTVIFPLLILSGMMLPLEQGPGWIKALSEINPLTHIVNAERALFSGDFAAPSVLFGVVAALIVAATGLAIGIRAMRSAAV